MLLRLAILCIGLVVAANETNEVDFLNQMSSRTGMLNAIKAGSKAGTAAAMDHSNKIILARGCDPVMAAKSMEFLPKMLSGVKITACTDDEEFLNLVESTHKFTAIFFAPGACRYDAAKQPIPGGNTRTQGWSLADYREFIRKHQGESVAIVETQEEAQIVPLLVEMLAKVDSASVSAAAEL